MEGPFLLLKAWLLAYVSICVYRRFFETDAPAEPEFERWIQTQPLLAAIAIEGALLDAFAATLAAELGPGQQAVATFGGWPWPNYALVLRVENKRDRIEIRAQSCRLLKTRGVPPPALIAVIRAAIERHPGAAKETWLDAGIVFDFRRSSPPAGGLELLPGGERLPRVRALAALPCWLVPAE